MRAASTPEPAVMHHVVQSMQTQACSGRRRQGDLRGPFFFFFLEFQGDMKE